MEPAVIVAGIGFRSGACRASLLSALEAAQRAAPGHVPQALATAAAKAETLRTIAAGLALPVVAVPNAALHRQKTLSDSAAARAAHGTGSVAEAAALAAAGPGARLLGPRAVSSDRRATAALALAKSAGTVTDTAEGTPK